MDESMKIEYEAKFANIDKNAIRKKLKDLGAKRVIPERLLRRYNFDFPKGHDIEHGWVRIRDEGDKLTMSIKIAAGDSIEGQKEACVVIDDLDEAMEFVKAVGCTQKAYQETLRETWKLDGAEVVIDTWPYLEPLMEIEAVSEAVVREVAQKLKLDYTKALFCSTTQLYADRYGIDHRVVNHTPKLTFDEKNPFV